MADAGAVQESLAHLSSGLRGIPSSPVRSMRLISSIFSCAVDVTNNQPDLQVEKYSFALTKG